MTENILVRLFEHNNWANQKTIEACSTLTDEQLDAEPRSPTRGSIRATLQHLVAAQRGYLSLLTMPVDARPHGELPFSDLQQVARATGDGLLALAKDEAGKSRLNLQTTDNYKVEPWVVMVQVINHATEHREQINSMLTALGITPPDLDGWSFGEATGALLPISE